MLVIKFEVYVSENKKYDLAPLEDVFKQGADLEEHEFDSLIMDRYEQALGLVDAFGMGILIFPKILGQLEGQCYLEDIMG